MSPGMHCIAHAVLVDATLTIWVCRTARAARAAEQIDLQHMHVLTEQYTPRQLSHMSQDLLKHGEQTRMHEVLASEMEQLLPQEAYVLCSGSNTPSSQANYHVTQPQHDSAHQNNSSSTYSTAGASQINSSSSSNSPGSRSAMGQAPCVLGATRVRPCCPTCVQPDVFEGECH